MLLYILNILCSHLILIKLLNNENNVRNKLKEGYKSIMVDEYNIKMLCNILKEENISSSLIGGYNNNKILSILSSTGNIKAFNQNKDKPEYVFCSINDQNRKDGVIKDISINNISENIKDLQNKNIYDGINDIDALEYTTLLDTNKNNQEIIKKAPLNSKNNDNQNINNIESINHYDNINLENYFYKKENKEEIHKRNNSDYNLIAKIESILKYYCKNDNCKNCKNNIECNKIKNIIKIINNIYNKDKYIRINRTPYYRSINHDGNNYNIYGNQLKLPYNSNLINNFNKRTCRKDNKIKNEDQIPLIKLKSNPTLEIRKKLECGRRFKKERDNGHKKYKDYEIRLMAALTPEYLGFN